MASFLERIMPIKQALLGLTLSLLLSSGVAVAADFNKGLMAAHLGDFKTALAEWTPLAEQGHDTAQYHLGVMHDNGKGVPENDKTAVKWYTLAAEQGHAKAQFNLGLSYVRGEGVLKDNRRAYMWWSLSAYNDGPERAGKNKDIVAKEMSPSDISKAQDMTRRCLDSGYTDCGVGFRSLTTTIVTEAPKSEEPYIHPECLDFLGPWSKQDEQFIDCSGLDFSKVQGQGNEFGVRYGEGQAVAYKYADVDLEFPTGMRLLEVGVDGGGSGLFSSIVLLDRDQQDKTKYEVLVRTPSGDRCNDGNKWVSEASADGFTFKSAATPFRLLNPDDTTDWRNWYLAKALMDEADEDLERPAVFNKWEPYEDVTNSASACFGWIVRKFDYATGFEIIGVELNPNLRTELKSDDTSLDSCIGHWLVSQINEDRFYFEIDDWTSRLLQLTNMCGQQTSAWVVQLGNFDNRTSAARLRDKVIKAGFAAYMVPNGELFKVLVGPELNRAKAKSLQEKLKIKLNMAGIVTNYYIINSLEATAVDKKLTRKKAAEKAANSHALASAVNYIRNEIIQRWVRPANARTGMVTELVIHLVPTGEVVDIEISYRDTSATDAFVASVVKAVRKVGRFDKLTQLDSELFDTNFRKFTVKFKPEDLRL